MLRFSSVYHEDGTLVTTSDRELDGLKFCGKYIPDIDFTTVVLMRRNGQIVIGFHNYSESNLIFDSGDGIVLL